MNIRSKNEILRASDCSSAKIPLSAGNHEIITLLPNPSVPTIRNSNPSVLDLFVLSTKDCHIMTSDPDPAGQSRRFGLPKLPQHYTQPCLTHVRRRDLARSGAGVGPLLKSSFLLLRRYGILGPTELSCVNPHPVQHHRELAGKRDLRPLHATSLRDPPSPSASRRRTVSLM